MRDRETERLVLRRWRAGDLDPYAAICADPVVMRYVGGGEARTREEAAAELAHIDAHWERHGWGLWAAELRETTELIGFIGLAEPTFIPELIGSVEVGWRLGRAHWNRGLATEGARAALDAAFGELELEQVVSLIHPENVASVRVAEKLGMRDDGRANHPRGLEVRVYRLSRDRRPGFRPSAQLR
jgi:RimJ/RimL family protein N-acetyltransferase